MRRGPNQMGGMGMGPQLPQGPHMGPNQMGGMGGPMQQQHMMGQDPNQYDPNQMQQQGMQQGMQQQGMMPGQQGMMGQQGQQQQQQPGQPGQQVINKLINKTVILYLFVSYHFTVVNFCCYLNRKANYFK